MKTSGTSTFKLGWWGLILLLMSVVFPLCIVLEIIGFQDSPVCPNSSLPWSLCSLVEVPFGGQGIIYWLIPILGCPMIGLLTALFLRLFAKGVSIGWILCLWIIVVPIACVSLGFVSFGDFVPENRKKEIAWRKFNSPEARKDRMNVFIDTMPISLRRLLGLKHIGNSAGHELSWELGVMSGKLHQDSVENRNRQAIAELAKEYPTIPQQIGRLLEWAGVITSARAEYDRRLPTELLHEYRPEDVLSFVKSGELSRQQWIGVCRYYSDINFRDKFPAGCPAVDEALKKRILAEVKDNGINDEDVFEFENAIREWPPAGLQNMNGKEKKDQQIKPAKLENERL